MAKSRRPFYARSHSAAPKLELTFLRAADPGQADKNYLIDALIASIHNNPLQWHHSRPLPGHIRRLEASLETTPFIRSANGVSLTERGTHLRERVQDVLAELKEIWREPDSDPGSEWDSDSGGQHNCGEIFCAEDLIRCHPHHPAAALHLIVGNTEEVLDHLRQQRVWLVLVELCSRTIPAIYHAG